jgi:hypothetical protein
MVSLIVTCSFLDIAETLLICVIHDSYSPLYLHCTLFTFTLPNLVCHSLPVCITFPSAFTEIGFSP